MIRKDSTSRIKYPKFPEWLKYESFMVNFHRCNKWRKEIIEIIEEQIEKDKEVMGSDLACWFDIRPLLEALKNVES